MRYRTTIVQSGNNTGIEVPPEVIEALGGNKRAPVKVTLNGYTYRNTIGSMGSRSMISLSAEHRTNAGVTGGQELDVEVVLDTEPRDVEVPADLAAALDAEPAARATFDKLSNSNKGWHVSQVTGAKTEETRQRRIEKSVATLKAGKPR
mgnify:CR=1 FL=1